MRVPRLAFHGCRGSAPPPENLVSPMSGVLLTVAQLVRGCTAAYNGIQTFTGSTGKGSLTL